LRLLALDTTLDACQAAVLAGGRLLACRTEPMRRGHQERLAPLIAEVLLEAGLQPSDLERVGVATGPGSFTGLRVGLAFAKGLALARAIPCVGVGVLPALAASVEHEGVVAAVIDARRGQVYLQAFRAGRALSEPEALFVEEGAARLRSLDAGLLVGSGAPLLAALAPAARAVALAAADPAVLARLAAEAPEPSAPPRPLYLRAPDARLPA
jgi:tRNA threonylcarbamoyladenosine biosynthesis protein TsaB